MRVKREHLTLLFNELYDRGDERFTLTHPCDEIGELITVELGEPNASTIHVDLDAAGYANARNDAELAHGSAIERDLPSVGDYVNTFVASDVIPLVNLAEVTTFLDR